MSVDIKVLKKLRELTQAPLSDCKRALEEWNNDIAVAQEWLKDRGAIKAAKNADRETNEWRILVTNQWWKVVWLKLACETDFVAKNDVFADLAHQINVIVRNLGRDLSCLSDLSESELTLMNKVLQDNFVTVGENMQIIDVFATTADNVFVYTHAGDKVSAVVFYDWEELIAKQVALQVASMNPLYLKRSDVPNEEIKEIELEIKEWLWDSKKSADIVNKILDWRLNKKISEFVLLEQSSIFDDSKTVWEMLWETEITWYIRFAI